MSPPAPNSAISLICLLLAPAALAGEAPDSKSRTQLLAERSGRPVDVLETAAPEALPLVESAVLFTMDGPDNASVVRSLPDVNSDGVGEVLVGIDESGTDNLFCLDGAASASSGTATALWSLETMDGVSGGSPWGDQSLVAAPDADADGAADLLFGTAWGGRTAYRIDGAAGAQRWKFDTYLTVESGWVYSLAEIGDVDGDGLPEVAFGTGSDSNSVYLIDGASTLPGQASFRWQHTAADAALSIRRLPDVTGDGIDEVLAAVGDFGDSLVALNGDTGLVEWTYAPGATVYAAGTLPDINGDGVGEALAVLWTSAGGAVRAVDGKTGTELWAGTTVTQNGMMVDLLEDISGNGIPEIIVSSWDNAVIVLEGKSGAELWRFTVGTLNGGDVWTARAVGDVTADGVEDVVAGSFDYHVYLLDGATGALFWSHDVGNRVFSVHPVDDLNGDGRPEVAVGTQDTNNQTVLHVLEGDGTFVFANGFESGNTLLWSSSSG